MGWTLHALYSRDTPIPKYIRLGRELGSMDDSKLNDILRRALSSNNMSKQEILEVVASFKTQVKSEPLSARSYLAREVLNVVVIVFYRALPCLLVLLYLLQRLESVWYEEPCLVPRLVPYGEVTLPFADCGICSNMSRVPVVENVTVASFLNEYAYSSRPVLVKGAAKDWPAARLFSYEYFRELYSQNPRTLHQGQFFAYSSSIESLDEFMSLSSDRASMKTETWYIGW